MEETNPYKGVRGGDPRLRPAKKEPLVRLEYVCAQCGEKKSELFSKTKDLTGRICVDCRNEAGRLKAKATREEQDKWWAEQRKRYLATPNRSDEELAALLLQYADAPHRKCDHCGKTFLLEDKSAPFYRDNRRRPNAVITVSYVIDQYDFELRGEENWRWYCLNCDEDIAGDV